jgi:ligand-binding SRPBCC domain-containing protein
METILLETAIRAPVTRCFDLARSIDFHQVTTSKTNERAIAGTVAGLINKGETVTWRAKHFGVYQELTSLISEMDAPFFFEDRMLKGAFKSICHSHYFEQKGNVTIMKDVFEFAAPFGIVGKIFCKLILRNYLKGFLIERNQMLKEAAEGERWKQFLT